jgi:NAD(P)-dependent dehydrogenase (short-subunit alcohol dehydrogenase family)
VSKIFISGINSQIGSAFAFDLMNQKSVEVLGTYREKNALTEKLELAGAGLYQCDFSDKQVIPELTKKIDFNQISCVCLFHGTMNPIGEFLDNDLTEWEESFQVNFLSIAGIIHDLLSKVEAGCRFITLAGGGVNGSPKAYSAYTVAKLALIKLNELLAEENPEQLFFNVGPGWVDSPIHKQTLDALDPTSGAYQETIRRYQDDDFVPIEKVIDVLNFFSFDAGIEFSGRNYSVANDDLHDDNLINKLKSCQHTYKLRRFNNEY